MTFCPPECIAKLQAPLHVRTSTKATTSHKAGPYFCLFAVAEKWQWFYVEDDNRFADSARLYNDVQGMYFSTSKKPDKGVLCMAQDCRLEVWSPSLHTTSAHCTYAA